MFDEFDLTVKELHAKKKKTSNIMDMWLKHVSSIENKSEFLNNKIINNNYVKNDKKDNKKNKDKSAKKIMSISLENNKENNDNNIEFLDSDDSASSDDDNKSTKSKKKEDYTIESFGYSNEDISLEDLLEIFQGPVPIEGAIIIATTNKFKEIYELCPALFRPGRLTPVEFDYLEQKTFTEISQYFYNKQPPFEININNKLSPSNIIEIVSKSKFIINNIDEQYDFFSKNIKKLLHN
jgi:hypothetical protein